MGSDSFISIVSIFISLYVIVLSIIGTSRTPVSEEVLKKKLDKKILRSLAFSIAMAVITIIISALLPSFITTDKTVRLINAFLMIFNLLFFVYMFIVLFLLSMKNMDAMAKEIDDEKKNQTKTYNLLNEIRILLSQKNKKK